MPLLWYSIRNLFRRPWRTAATMFGIAMTIFTTTLMLSLSRGIELRTGSTGEKSNILAISRNGQNVMFSSITDEEIVSLYDLPDIAKSMNGEPLVSPEIMHMAHARIENQDGRRAPVNVRGVQPVAYEVHKKVRLIEGKLPEDDFDILIGKMVYVRLGLSKDSLKPGKTIYFEKQSWKICGIFEAENSLFEAELWVRDTTLQTILNMQGCTFMTIGFTNDDAAGKAVARFSQPGAIEKYFKGWTEFGYYQEFGKSIEWVMWLCGIMVTAISTAGALIGINTMYTAIMDRMSEFGTLRVLGFRRRDILISLLIESICISLAGGIVGTAAGLFLNNIPLKFSTSAFLLVVDSKIVAIGIGLSLLIGILGCLLPAFRSFRLRILDALRQA